MYAQYFHPETLLERVRDVAFYRRPRTLFKGFKVPDWATAEKRHGWELETGVGKRYERLELRVDSHAVRGRENGTQSH
jgi:hypothetical protein